MRDNNIANALFGQQSVRSLEKVNYNYGDGEGAHPHILFVLHQVSGCIHFTVDNIYFAKTVIKVNL